MKIVILGLSITSSWGNGHATTYRGLVRELVARGHEVLFLERDKPWYASNRDLPLPPYGTTRLYGSVDELRTGFRAELFEADAVIVGSYVPEGIAVGEWVTQQVEGVTAFYDIDTPVTLSKLAAEDCDYLSPELIPAYSLYLSFTGGPVLENIQKRYGSPAAHPLYCSVDPTLYHPEKNTNLRWDLGYLGTYSPDRQPALEEMLLGPARYEPTARMVVAGPQYPADIQWPVNVERIEHLPPAEHRCFYNAQRFTLNVTRAEMIRTGYSPSVRLFEAAACGVPIISDPWKGIDTFFTPGKEILLATRADEVSELLRNTSAEEARIIGERARQRVLTEHTAAHRAAELEALLLQASGSGERGAHRTNYLKTVAVS